MRHSAESRLHLCGIAQSRFLLSNLIEYLCKFESLCKTVLAHVSGDLGVQFNEKTEGQKSHDTVPLSITLVFKGHLREKKR
jgi:hypothetical protein